MFRTVCISLLLLLTSTAYSKDLQCSSEQPKDKGCFCETKNFRTRVVTCSNLNHQEAAEELKRYQGLYLHILEMKNFHASEKICFLAFLTTTNVTTVRFSGGTLFDSHTRNCPRLPSIKFLTFYKEPVMVYPKFKWQFSELLENLELLTIFNVTKNANVLQLKSKSLSGLQIINVNMNLILENLYISEIPSKNLEIVSVTNCQISELKNPGKDFGEHRKRIRTLDLSINDIKTIDENYFNDFVNLQKLHLGHNSMAYISVPESMKKLTHLKLDDNPSLTILRLPRSVWLNLEELFLKGTNLSCGPQFEFLFNGIGRVDEDCSQKVKDEATCLASDGSKKQICDLTYEEIRQGISHTVDVDILSRESSPEFSRDVSV